MNYMFSESGIKDFSGRLFQFSKERTERCMNDLIEFQYQYDKNNRPLISGLMLHQALGIKTPYLSVVYIVPLSLSASRVLRFSAFLFRTAIARAFFVPTITMTFFARVTPV